MIRISSRVNNSFVSLLKPNVLLIKINYSGPKNSIIIPRYRSAQTVSLENKKEITELNLLEFVFRIGVLGVAEPNEKQFLDLYVFV